MQYYCEYMGCIEVDRHRYAIATYGAHGVGSLLHFMWLLDIKFNLSCLCRQINQITKVQLVSNLKK